MEKLLEFLFPNIIDNADANTAMNWFIAAVVVAILVAGLSFGFKALRKSMAGHHDKKIWSRGKTWLSFFIGLLPVMITLTITWWLVTDFYEFVGISYLKGLMMAWVLYLLIMIFGHLVSPWRRELI